MAHERTDSYLKDSISLFQYYKRLGETAMAQCPDEGLLALLDDQSNSIATIVKHLWGNMISRWTDFLTADGEKPSVMQAINRQVAHYNYHVGQMVLLARHYAGPNWKSLTVPKNKSQEFNADVAAGKKSQR